MANIYIKDNTNKKIRIFLKETLKNNSKQVFIIKK